MIPDKAVEAAVNARGRRNNPKWDNDIWGYEQFSEDQKKFLRNEAREMLEAAAPFIRAEALRDAAEDFGTPNDVEILPVEFDWPADARRTREHLRRRADELDPQ